jgi:hypothetical protein
MVRVYLMPFHNFFLPPRVLCCTVWLRMLFFNISAFQAPNILCQIEFQESVN